MAYFSGIDTEWRYRVALIDFHFSDCMPDRFYQYCNSANGNSPLN